MFFCGEQLTVYNSYTNAQKVKEYLPTVINGVHWFGSEKVTVTDEGLLSAKKYTIRVPIDADFSGKRYVGPLEYSKTEDKSTVFTFNEGDIIVKGIATEVGEEAKPSILQNRYEEVVTVVSVTDDRNAPHGKHWKVVCK